MVLLIVLATFAARSRFVAADAYWRIDTHTATPMNQTGHWELLGHYNGVGPDDGEWGQGVSRSGGNTCHLNDYCTYWYILAPNPRPGFTPTATGSINFPVGYNPNTGLYFY